MRTTTDESGGVLRLAGGLGICETEQLHRTLVEALNKASSLTLDLSEVETCDTAALQLLYSARITAERSGKSIKIQGASQPVLATCETLGVPVEALSSERPPEHA